MRKIIKNDKTEELKVGNKIIFIIESIKRVDNDEITEMNFVKGKTDDGKNTVSEEWIEKKVVKLNEIILRPPQ